MWLSHICAVPSSCTIFHRPCAPFYYKIFSTVLATAPLLLFYSREYTRISFHSTVPSSSPKSSFDHLRPVSFGGESNFRNREFNSDERGRNRDSFPPKFSTNSNRGDSKGHTMGWKLAHPKNGDRQPVFNFSNRFHRRYISIKGCRADRNRCTTRAKWPYRFCFLLQFIVTRPLLAETNDFHRLMNRSR